MKKDLLQGSLLLLVPAVVFLLGLTSPVWCGCNAPPNLGGCPIKAGGQVVFDRCFGSAPWDNNSTAQGTAVCDLYLKINKAKEQLRDFPEPWKSQIESELEDWKKTTLKGAIDQDAINTLTNAGHYLDIILDDINGYINDPTCGVHGTIQKVDTWLNNRAKEFNTWVQLAGMTGQISNNVTRAETSAAEAGIRLATIMASPDTYSEETRQSLDKLITALNEYKTSMEDLADTDTSAFTDGTSQGLELAQWVTNCAACAGFLADSVKNYATGATAAIGGSSACPETIEAAGGSCWGIPGGVVVGGFGVLEDAIASLPCKAAADGAAHASEYGNTLVRVINTVAELIDKTAQCYIKYNLVVKAMDGFADNASGDIARSIGPVRDKLVESGRHLEDANAVLQHDFFPLVKVYSRGRIDEFSGNVEHVLTCRNKARQVAMEAGHDVVRASTNLGDALSHAVDAGRVVGNIGSGIERGWNRVASRSVLRNIDDYNELNNKINKWNQELSIAAGQFFTGNWNDAVDSANNLLADLGNQLQEIVTQVYKDFKSGYACTDCLDARGDFRTARSKAVVALSIFKQKIQQYSSSSGHMLPQVRVDMAVTGALPSLSLSGSTHLGRMPSFSGLRSSKGNHGRSTGGRGAGKNTAARGNHHVSGKNSPALSGKDISRKVTKSLHGKIRINRVRPARIRISAGDGLKVTVRGEHLDQVTAIMVMAGTRPSKEITVRIARKTDRGLEMVVRADGRAKSGRYGFVAVAGKKRVSIDHKLASLEIMRATSGLAARPGKANGSGRKSKVGQGSVSIRHASSRYVKLAAGEEQKLRFDGTNLNLVKKIEVTDGKRSVGGVSTKINHKSKNRLELTILADRRAKPGHYGFVAVAGKNRLQVSKKLVNMEVKRGKPASGKPALVVVARPRKGHGSGPKGNGQIGVSVKRASSRHIKLAAGEEQKLRFDGTNLNLVKKIEVTDGRKRIHGMLATLNRKAKSRLDLTVASDKRVRPGRYTINLLVAKKSVPIPARIFIIEVMRPRPSKTNRPATGKAGQVGVHGAAAGSKKGSAPPSHKKELSAPVVSSCSPHQITLVSNSGEVRVKLKGRNLDCVKKIEVVHGKKTIREVRVRRGKKSSGVMEITFKVGSGARAGKQYQLRLFAGKQVVLVPVKKLSIQVVPGKTHAKGKKIRR